MRTYLTALIGETIPTLQGKPNRIISVKGKTVMVGTSRKETGSPVSISFVQSAIDEVFDGKEVLLGPVGRYGFVGAVLMTFDEVEVLARPRRAHLIDKANVSAKLWSDEENRAAVEAYLDMLERHLAGDDVVKKVLVERLQAGSLSGRSRRSVESRFQNISYVLESNGLPWVKGYVPLPNVGTEVKARLESNIASSDTGFLDAYRPTADSGELADRVSQIRTPGLLMPQVTGEIPEHRVSGSKHFVRNPQVVAWVLEQADGFCELCEESGPFLSNQSPFLEVHHVLPLSKGGTDSVDNAVAICPNCHRRCHLGDDHETATAGLYESVSRLRRL